MEALQFNTDYIEYEEIVLKSKKQYIIKGFASIADPDDEHDLIDEEGQESLLQEFRTKNITIDPPDHASWTDPDTGEVLDWPRDTMPIGRVIKAEMGEKNGKRGVVVTAEMNQHHPFFKSIWNSIKERFLHSFSVGFYTVGRPIKKMVDGIATNVIKAVNLVNLTLTGNPVNQGAKFAPMLKAQITKAVEEEEIMQQDIATIKSDLSEIKKLLKSQESGNEVNTVAEEEPKPEEQPQEEAPAQPEPAKEEAAEEQPAEEAPAEPAGEGDQPEGEEGSDASLKSVIAAVDTLKEENAKLKSKIEELEKKLEEPQLKAQGAKPEAPAVEVEAPKSILAAIR